MDGNDGSCSDNSQELVEKELHRGSHQPYPLTFFVVFHSQIKWKSLRAEIQLDFNSNYRKERDPIYYYHLYIPSRHRH